MYVTQKYPWIFTQYEYMDAIQDADLGRKNVQNYLVKGEAGTQNKICSETT